MKNSKCALEDRTEGNESLAAALSPLRTAALGLLLTAAIAAIILVAVTLIGFLGSFLVSEGVVSFGQITSIPSVVSVVFFGSLVIAALICLGVDYTAIRPLRRMTSAMSQLSAGNFDYRISGESRFRLREVDEFARSFNRAAEELAGTEMIRSSFISDFSHEFARPSARCSRFASRSASLLLANPRTGHA